MLWPNWLTYEGLHAASTERLILASAPLAQRDIRHTRRGAAQTGKKCTIKTHRNRVFLTEMVGT